MLSLTLTVVVPEQPSATESSKVEHKTARECRKWCSHDNSNEQKSDQRKCTQCDIRSKKQVNSSQKVSEGQRDEVKESVY